jgi:hypothetical protein
MHPVIAMTARTCRRQDYAAHLAITSGIHSPENGAGIPMNKRSHIPKSSDDELSFFGRIKSHFTIDLKSFCVPFALSTIVLVTGNYLQNVFETGPNSILFRLWPFNRVYVEQLASSPYDSSEIRWFFAVVSCSNAIWIIFLCWKVIFELFRRDVAFPQPKSPIVASFIVRFFVASCVILTLFIPIGMAGFSTQVDSLFIISFKQSIAVGAIKVVMIEMFGLYVGAAFFLEFGGLGVRYLLSRKLGLFLAKTERSSKAEPETAPWSDSP